MTSETPIKSGKNTPAIAVEHLSKQFRLGFTRRLVTAVVNAHFTVKKGCAFGLVGPNGAGKTTTIKALMGLIKPTSGSLYIDGVAVPNVKSRQRLGYLPENPHFYDHLKAEEYLVFAGMLCGMGKKETLVKAEELLEFVGLEMAKNKAIRKFSKGMVQRLGLAQTLIHDPEIVVLDEPQSGLDPIGRKEVKDMILSLKAKGRTVFFSSHILHDVEDVCDEIAVLINGRVREVGHVETLLRPEILQNEIEISGVSQAFLENFQKKALRCQHQTDTTLFFFSGDQDSSKIAQEVISAGGLVHRLIPHRERLEDLFVREAKTPEQEEKT